MADETEIALLDLRVFLDKWSGVITEAAGERAAAEFVDELQGFMRLTMEAVRVAVAEGLRAAGGATRE